MIGSCNIGTPAGGRLGNQMFTYASSKGIAIKHGQQHCISLPIDHSNEIKKIPGLLKCFDIPHLNVVPRSYFIRRKGPKNMWFDEQLLIECEDRASIGSYYLQSEKYFRHAKKEIINDFKFNKHHIKRGQDWLKKNNFPIGIHDCIAMHIRRTDYLWKDVNSTTPCLTYQNDIGYFEKCLNMLPDDLPVLIFTDDPEWCGNIKLFKHGRFRIVSGNEFRDLYLMTLFNYHIISNSTYSWWGAYLSKSKKILVPYQWYSVNAQHSEKRCESQIPEDDHWVRVKY